MVIHVNDDLPPNDLDVNRMPSARGLAHLLGVGARPARRRRRNAHPQRLRLAREPRHLAERAAATQWFGQR